MIMLLHNRIPINVSLLNSSLLDMAVGMTGDGVNPLTHRIMVNRVGDVDTEGTQYGWGLRLLDNLLVRIFGVGGLMDHLSST